MSWPSSYGYKYTPIGLRQREKRDEFGKRSICTTVHLPEGGHLLEIDREYGIDGSMSKRIAEKYPVDNFPRVFLTSLLYPERYKREDYCGFMPYTPAIAAVRARI